MRLHSSFLMLYSSSLSVARSMLHWDVNNGIGRRAWASNENAEEAITTAMERNPLLKVTMPQHADEALLDQLSASAAETKSE